MAWLCVTVENCFPSDGRKGDDALSSQLPDRNRRDVIAEREDSYASLQMGRR
jgi:hypothetical protein